MELDKTGELSIENGIATGLMNGQVFGINLSVKPRGLGVDERRYPFLAKERRENEVTGIMDFGNGQHEQLTLRLLDFVGGATIFKYELSEILEEKIDTIHVMD